MAIIDGLAVIAALGFILLGIAVAKRARERAKPEITGAANAEQAKRDGKRRCGFCRKSTNPDVDVYVDNTWYHLSCYTNTQDKKN